MKTKLYLLVLIAAISTHAANITWTNSASGNWNVAVNWSPNQVPGDSDTAIITNGVAVTLTSDVAIASLELTSGEINGSGVLTVNDSFGLASGNLVCPITILSNAVANLTGGCTLYGPLTNNGTVNWLGGDLTVDYNPSEGAYGAIWNQAGAQWNIQCDQSLTYNNVYGQGAFNNAGTITKSGTSGTTAVNLGFYNSGTVQAQSGTIVFQSGATLNGGNYLPSSAIDFEGNIALAGPITNLELSGVTVSGLSNLVETASLTNCTINDQETIVGVVNLSGGSLQPSASLTVASNGVLSLAGGWIVYSPLTNNGTVNWLGGDLTVDYNPSEGAYGAIWNQAGAQWNIQCDQSLTYNNVYGQGAFNNAGTITKSGTSGTTAVNLGFYNSGTVQAQSGTIVFQSGATLNGGNYLPSSAIDFEGNIALAGPITNLELSGVTVSGLSNLVETASLTNCTINDQETIVGVVNLSGGSLQPSASLTVASNGVLSLAGGWIVYSPLTNNGTVNWLGGDLTVDYNPSEGAYGAIWNQAGAQWNIQCDQSLTYNNVYGRGAFNNAGTITKSGTSGTTAVNLGFYNSGTVQAQSGTLNFNSNFTTTGGELLFGLSSLTSYGSINIAGNAMLGGTVSVTWLDGYVPAAGNSFTIIKYGSYSGTFTNVDFPAVALWSTNYTAGSFTVTVVSINQLAFTTQPVSGKLTNEVIPPVVVQVEDPLGDPIATNGVPVTLSLNSGNGILSGTLTQMTDSTGKAMFSDLSLDQVGVKTLLASAPLLSPATSAPFQIVPVIELQWTSGGFLITLNGTNSVGPTIISTSTNLLSWTPIYTNPPTVNVIQFLDTSSTNFPIRFYRILEQ